MANFKELGKVPEDQVRNFRNDMYLTSESPRLMKKSGDGHVSDADRPCWRITTSTWTRDEVYPDLVKVAVAIALGLGRMVGWKRIVVTVGDKMGKDHLTYGQGCLWLGY